MSKEGEEAKDDNLSLDEDFFRKIGIHGNSTSGSDLVSTYIQEEAKNDADQALQVAKEAQGNLDALTKELESTKKDLRTITKEVQASRNKNLETLAIFVALFTFASLSFQMFANVDKRYWVPLGLVLLGGLMLFCTVLASLSSMAIDGWWRRNGIMSFCGLMAFLLLGFGAYFYREALIKQDTDSMKCAKLAQKILSSESSKQQDMDVYNLVCRIKI